LAAVTITKICIVIKRFKMTQRKNLFKYLMQYQTHVQWRIQDLTLGAWTFSTYTYIKNEIFTRNMTNVTKTHKKLTTCRFACSVDAHLLNIMLLQGIKHEVLESKNWTVHMHATNCIFNLRHRNENDKNVVCLILKRYAVGNFKIWPHAVHRPKIKKYAVREGVRGFFLFHYH